MQTQRVPPPVKSDIAATHTTGQASMLINEGHSTARNGSIVRGQQPIARFRVIQRLSGKPVAIAEIAAEGDGAPAAGDTVRSGG